MQLKFCVLIFSSKCNAKRSAERGAGFAVLSANEFL